MSTDTLDPLQIHSGDIGETIGYFHGTPIVEVNPKATRKREDEDRHARIARSKVYAQEHPDE